jgi:arylsulfatase A-like enzyme
MHKVNDRILSFAKVACWLYFAGVIFIVNEVVRNGETFSFYHIYWLDVAASYGCLAALALVGVLCAALVLKGIELVGRRLNARWLQELPWATAFATFIAVCLNIGRLILASTGQKLISIAPLYQLFVFFGIGLIIFAIFNKTLIAWMADMVPLILPFAASMAVLSIILSTYLFLEPLNKGKPAPVSLADPTNKPPDVILIVLDSLTIRDMSMYGYPLPTTPNLDRITKTWTVYQNAHSSGTGTLAAMPTLLTGRYPYTDEWYRYGDWTRQGIGWMDLATAMTNLGYETVFTREVGYWPQLYHLHTGWKKLTYGILRDFGKSLIIEYFPFSSVAGTSSADSFPGSALDSKYLQVEQYLNSKSRVDVSTRNPFFLYFNANRPHGPYLAGEFMGRFLPISAGLVDSKSQMSLLFKVNNPDDYDRANLINELRLRYDENILKADAQLGHLLAMIQTSGLYDSSLIIITADHGTVFQSEFAGYYSPLMLAPEHSIPLLIKYPLQTEGKHVQEIVTNADIAPTMLDAIGAVFPADYMDGESLLEDNLSGGERVVFVRLPNSKSGEHVFAALSGTLALVQRGDNRALYDLSRDPDEQVDISGQVKHECLDAALDLYEQRINIARDGTLITSTLKPRCVMIP